MIGLTRLANFRAAVSEVVAKNVDGAIVEMGVWRGGAMLYAAAVLRDMGVQRPLHLFDAFHTMPGYGGASSFLSVRDTDVRSSFVDFNLQGPYVHYHVGLFKDTVKKWGTEPIAVLRIDGNFYDSYQDALYYMYDKVPIGGIVIFDDVYTHPAVMRCWKDFKREQKLPETLNRIDEDSSWFRKEHAIKIDWSLFHPAQDANK